MQLSLARPRRPHVRGEAFGDRHALWRKERLRAVPRTENAAGVDRPGLGAQPLMARGSLARERCGPRGYGPVLRGSVPRAS